ncbi:Uncharacterised protein [Mycobacterium tuberculosis]|nr:Uncharacterised protein [Mycobacterium tuberculosis]
MQKRSADTTSRIGIAVSTRFTNSLAMVANMRMPRMRNVRKRGPGVPEPPEQYPTL